jgi:hypothetical protein
MYLGGAPENPLVDSKLGEYPLKAYIHVLVGCSQLATFLGTLDSKYRFCFLSKIHSFFVAACTDSQRIDSKSLRIHIPGTPNSMVRAHTSALHSIACEWIVAVFARVGWINRH